MLLDCDEGGARQAPKVTRRGAVLVSLDSPPTHAPVGGILKRLTTLLAVLPARLGRTGAEGSLSVATASDEISNPTSSVFRAEGKGLILLMPANAARRRFLIYNDSPCLLKVKLGLGAGEGSFSFALEPKCFYESKTYPTYTGIVTGYGRTIAAQITEM